MNARIWGIIGGVALVLALLSPLVLGSSKKVEQLFEAAEALSERSDYENAIAKYKEALKESKKFGTKTEHIDKDFTTLANLKIAQCYYELAEDSSDVRHYQSALTHVRKVVLDAKVAEHQEELIYLWAETLYKTGKLEEAKSKFSGLIERFSNSRWVPKALYAVGDINYQQENCEEALNAFQKLVTEFPHSEFRQNAELRIAELTQLCDDPPPPETECETVYRAAFDLQRRDKVYDAHQLYTDLIVQFPECEYVVDAYIGIAEIHFEAEDYVNARASYEEAMRNTDDEERITELYEAYHRTYLIPVYANGTRQVQPNDELFVKARLLRKEELFLEAAEIYEKLANSNLSVEDTAYALYWAGRCYHESILQNPASTDVTLFKKPVDIFKNLIANHENSSYDIKAYYYLVLVYSIWAEKLGDQSKCQSVIDTVEEANTKYVDNDDTTIQGWLSRMQELKNEALEKSPLPPDPLKEEAERAINAAETAIDRVKQENRELQLIHDAEEHLEHAKQQMRRNNYRVALNQAKEVLKIINRRSPPIPLVQRYVNEGHIHLRQGKLEKAMEKANQALDLDRNYPPAHELLSKIKQRYYGLGWIFFDEEQYDQAIAAFQNAIGIDPKFKEAHNHLGVVYIKQENYAEAIEVLKEALKIDEQFKEAYFNLALAHLELGEFEAAAKAANAALNIDPGYEPAKIIIKLIEDRC